MEFFTFPNLSFWYLPSQKPFHSPRILILLLSCLFFFLNSGKTTCSICCVYKTCSPHNYNKTYNFKILFIHLSLPLANISQSMYLRKIAPQEKKSLLKKRVSYFKNGKICIVYSITSMVISNAYAKDSKKFLRKETYLTWSNLFHSV